MQNDDTTNPGMLWVLDGQKLWNSKAGAAAKACADCHQDVRVSMKGVAAQYPAFDRTRGARQSRAAYQSVPHPAAASDTACDESRDLLALTALIARQSRGVPIETGAAPQLARFIANGRDLFMQRQGQLDLACSNCHDDNWDKRLAGAAITRDIRTAIRCTGWSGNRSARCSAACAPA